MFLVLVAFAFAGCTKHRRNHLRVGVLNRPLSLKSWKIRDGVSTLVGGQIHRGLMYLDAQTGEHRPFAALRWSIEPEAGIAWFELDRTKRLHDGTLLTCYLVKTSLERLKDPKFESSVTLPKRATIKCSSDDRLEILLKPIPAKLLDILSSPVAGISKEDGLIGLGPYRLERESGSEIILRRANGDGPEQITFLVSTHDSLVADFKARRVDDILYLGLFQSVALDCTRVRGLSPTSFWLGVNSRAWAFKDRLVRNAVLDLIRAGLHSEPIFSGEIQNDTLIPFGITGSRGPSSLPSVEQIRTLSAKVSPYVGKWGKVPLALRKSHEQEYDWARLFRRVDPAGSIFDVRFLENEEFFARYYSRSLSLFMIGANATRNDPFEVLSFFRAKDFVNQSGISNPVVDLLSEKAMLATSSDEVTRLARQADRWIIDEGYALPLFSKRFSGCIQPYLAGYQISPLGPLSIDYSKVSFTQ